MDKYNAIIVTGLAFLCYGLYDMYGLGFAAAICGAAIVLIGILGDIWA